MKMCKDCGCGSACTKEKPFDPTKPVQTRNGKPARIICTDAKNVVGRPIVALITNNLGHEETVLRNTDGTSVVGPQFDLVNVPERTEKFVNYYKNGEPFAFHPTRKSADRGAILPKTGETGRDGLIKLSFEDGELVNVELIKE
jgi:hypothetical protein